MVNKKIFACLFLLIAGSLFASVESAGAVTACGPDAAIETGETYQCVKDEAECTKLKGTLYTGLGKEKCPLAIITPGLQPCCAIPKPEAAAATGSQAVPQTGSTAAWDYNTGGTGIRLVSCTQSGNCTINDIVQQGIYVADFLIGISGALFLIAFIWGGAMYLLSFGRSGWVEKGRDAMVKSMIGIVFIILAWTIVTFVAESLGYKGL